MITTVATSTAKQVLSPRPAAHTVPVAHGASCYGSPRRMGRSRSLVRRIFHGGHDGARSKHCSQSGRWFDVLLLPSYAGMATAAHRCSWRRHDSSHVHDADGARLAQPAGRADPLRTGIGATMTLLFEGGRLFGVGAAVPTPGCHHRLDRFGGHVRVRCGLGTLLGPCQRERSLFSLSEVVQSVKATESEIGRRFERGSSGTEPSVGTVSARPRQPEPFVRGVAFPPTAEVPYPRADPADVRRLPVDVWHAASVPVGVRLEMVGDAQAVDVAYRTTNGNLGYRGDGAGVTFSVWRGGRQVDEAEAELGDGLIRLQLGTMVPERPATVYLPEGMLPVVRSLTAVHGEIAPAPAEPRWLAYGDSSTQGWVASGPAQAWAAIAARKAGLDLVNMGYRAVGRRRHRLRRAAGRSRGRDHHHQLRRELLEPRPPQSGHDRGGPRCLPRHRPPGASRDSDHRDESGGLARGRPFPQPARCHPRRHPRVDRVGDPLANAGGRRQSRSPPRPRRDRRVVI